MRKILRIFLTNEQRFQLLRWSPLQKTRRFIKPASMGDLRSTKPVSAVWGLDQGTPVDSYYVEQFLETHKNDISGQVVEGISSQFTQRYGHNVQKRDILDIDKDNSKATIITDLAAADNVEPNLFDCFIFPQRLHLIYDMEAALHHARRILRPGGVLLATVPTISKINSKSKVRDDYWRLTASSCQRMFGDVFGTDNITVHSYGNVLTSITNLAGIVQEQLTEEDLNDHDEYFPVVIGIRAVK